ncbi:MAG: exosortase/archaeosortase family protein, partial [Limisphaerales bacterium]
WMYSAYSAPQADQGHGFLIPFAVLILFWCKRQGLLALPRKTWWPGLILLGLALGLHLVGYLIQLPAISIVALFSGIYFLMALAWGWRWSKASFFPFVLFVFCIPMPGLMDRITAPLRMLATNITYGFCKSLLGLDLIRRGTQLFDAGGTYSYDVAAACGGIRSLISLLALTTIYGMITFKTPWKRAAIIFSALPLSVACNVVRLIGIVIAAEAFGQKAGDFFHEWSGFFTYGLAIAVVLLLGYWWKERETAPVLLQTKTT